MRYVAFLRAINVTNRFVRMEDLRRMMAGLDGLANVATFIQSGNVLFEAAGERAALENAIEAHLQAHLGFAVPAFLRSAAEMSAVVSGWPFAAEEQAEDIIGYVAFVRAAQPAEMQERIAALSGVVDVLRLSGSEIYWLYYRGRGKTGVTLNRLERTLGCEVTVRNITTVRKLAARMAGQP